MRTLSSSDTSTGTALGTVRVVCISYCCIGLHALLRQAGIMMGCMITPFFNERYGRRWTFVTLGIIGFVSFFSTNLPSSDESLSVLSEHSFKPAQLSGIRTGP